MRPAQLNRLFRRFPGKDAEEKAGRESVAAADAVKNMKLAGGGDVRLAVDPGDGSPIVPVRRVYLSQCRRNNLDLGMLLHYALDHAEKGRRIKLGPGGDLRTRNAKTFLQVLFVADNHIDVLHDAPDHRG